MIYQMCSVPRYVSLIYRKNLNVVFNKLNDNQAFPHLLYNDVISGPSAEVAEMLRKIRAYHMAMFVNKNIGPRRNYHWSSIVTVL